MYSGVDNYFYHGVTGAFTVGCGNCSPGYFAGTTPNFNFDVKSDARVAPVADGIQLGQYGSVFRGELHSERPHQLQRAGYQQRSDRTG